MTSRADNWQQIGRKGWADEVDEDWGSSGDLASPVFDDATNHYRSAEGVWHEDISVERGQSQQRLDLDSGFMRSIRQNQYARDEHEQAWQDAYSNAPPFQQRWGVGVKVQPQRRGDEGQWQQSQAAHGTTWRKEQPEVANDKPWWRKAADIQHSTEVRILSRSEAERRSMPNNQPELLPQSAEPGYHRPQMPKTQHGSAPVVSHEVLEAQLLHRNRASAKAHRLSYASTQGPQLTQHGPPLIDSQGVAMGIPVDWAMGPAASLQPYTCSEVRRQNVPPPEAPMAVSALAPGVVAEHAEAAAKPAKQEKVKMGFQLYRPPTVLAQASTAAPLGKEDRMDISEQLPAASSRQSAPGAGRQPSRASLQPQSQQGDGATKAAVRAIHAATKDRMAAALNSSVTKSSERRIAKQPKQDRGEAAQPGPQHCSDSSASAARENDAQPLPNSSASKERQRARKPRVGAKSGDLNPPDTKSGSSKALPDRQAVSLPRRPAQQTMSSREGAESRGSPHADDAACKQSSGKSRRAPAVLEKAREVSSAEPRSRPIKEQAKGPKNDRQHLSTASEQPAASREVKQGRAQPKQLLTELVKQAAVFNASPIKRQPPSTQSTSRAAPQIAALSQGANFSAPPGLETAVPAAAASRKAGA